MRCDLGIHAREKRERVCVNVREYVHLSVVCMRVCYCCYCCFSVNLFAKGGGEVGKGRVGARR